MEELRRQLEASSEYVTQRHAIGQSLATFPGYSIVNNLILHQKRIWLPRGLPLIPTLLTKFHSTPTGGHMGVAKTLARVSENFSWPGLRMDVTKFVAQCVDCQLTKYETKKSAGLLCPLPVP